MKQFKVIVVLTIVFVGMLIGLTSCKEPVEELHVHDYKEWVVLNEATCTSSGLKGRDCKTCPAFEREEIEKIEHEYVSSILIEATCNNAGSKLYTCKYCKDIKIESIAATGHEYSNGVCSKCNKSETENPTFTISFELNGGELYTTSVSYEKGTKITLPNPTKENYIFKGWCTTSSLDKVDRKSVV